MPNIEIELHGLTLKEICQKYPDAIVEAIERHAIESKVAREVAKWAFKYLPNCDKRDEFRKLLVEEDVPVKEDRSVTCRYYKKGNRVCKHKPYFVCGERPCRIVGRNVVEKNWVFFMKCQDCPCRFVCQFMPGKPGCDVCLETMMELDFKGLFTSKGV